MLELSRGFKAFFAQPARGRLSVNVSGLAVLALSLLAGLIYAFVVLGPRPLNPTNVSWLGADVDPSAAYIGWAFFRQEPHLAFPLGWESGLGYPLGEPDGYFDNIPLLAVVAWFFRGILPENFQYFGPYFALCCVLQFYFGYRISRRVSGDNAAAGLIGGAFFLIAPPFIFKGAQLADFAQASHWVILAALDRLLAPITRLSAVQILPSATLCFLAATINPYIAVMVLLVSCVTCARPLISREKQFGYVCLGLGGALCSTVLGLALFGFVRTGDISLYSGVGYGFYSMNLLAPIDPQATGSLFLKQQAINPGQYEGYNYLGFGLLLLGIAAVARAPSSLCALLRRTAVPALIIVGLSLLLALSTKATVGTRVLYDFAAPKFIMQVLAAFRSSGRLFWPAYYLILAGVIAAATRAFRGRWLHVALTAALIVQLFDVGSLSTAARRHWQSTSAPALPAAAPWTGLGRMHKHLVVVPAWQCAAEPLGGINGFTMFDRLALQQHMTVNSMLVGRLSDAQYNFFCNEETVRLDQNGLQTDTVYVFDKNMSARLIGLDYHSEYCRHEDQYILCSRTAGRSGLEPAVLEDLEILHPGERISFAGSNKIADRVIGRGWSFAEPWGRWMLGRSATLVFRLPAAAPEDVQIELAVTPYIRPAHQSLDVLANGKLVKQQTFEQATPAVVQIVIPKQLIGSDGLVRLDLHPSEPVSPAALGLSKDSRELSIGITQLRIRPLDGSDIELLHLGDSVSFAGSDKIADRLVGTGWSVEEPWGRWMQGRSATLAFRLPSKPPGAIRIDLSVTPYIQPKHPRQSLDVLANGKLVTQRTFEQATPSNVQIVVPEQLIGSDGLVRLELHSPDAVSPAALGLSADTREISIGLTQLRIQGPEN